MSPGGLPSSNLVLSGKSVDGIVTLTLDSQGKRRVACHMYNYLPCNAKQPVLHPKPGIQKVRESTCMCACVVFILTSDLMNPLMA